MYSERLTIEDVQEELGGVSRDTVKRLMRDGKLGYVQATPRTRLVLRSQLEAYIASQTVPGEHDPLPTPRQVPPLAVIGSRG